MRKYHIYRQNQTCLSEPSDYAYAGECGGFLWLNGEILLEIDALNWYR